MIKEQATSETQTQKQQRGNGSELSSLVMRLKRYNEWRHGGDAEQPDPKAIGRDIDAAIEAIHTLIDILGCKP